MTSGTMRAESKSSQGIVDALEAAGVKVDKLDASDAVDKDASLAIPNPDRLYCGTSESQGDRNPAWQYHGKPAESP